MQLFAIAYMCQIAGVRLIIKGGKILLAIINTKVEIFLFFKNHSFSKARGYFLNCLKTPVAKINCALLNKIYYLLNFQLLRVFDKSSMLMLCIVSSGVKLFSVF